MSISTLLFEYINRFLNLRHYFFNPTYKVLSFQNPMLILQVEEHVVTLTPFIRHINCENRIVYTLASAKIKFTEAATRFDKVCELYVFYSGHCRVKSIYKFFPGFLSPGGS